jgi:RNA recognition motif-containing protein
MKNKLFLGGLAWATTEATLRDASRAYGEIEDVKVIMDRDTGRSKGFGFVTFATEEAALKCKSEMDGQLIDGRAVKVDFPREREDRGDSHGYGGGGGRSGGFGGGGGGGGGGFGRGPRGY